MLDDAPFLVLWFFDSRGEWYFRSAALALLMFSIGGVTPENERASDWVDESVAQWIESETRAMETVWGPGEKRSALAFVHIPPFVQIFITI